MCVPARNQEVNLAKACLSSPRIGDELERDQLTSIFDNGPPRPSSEGLSKSSTSILSIVKDPKVTRRR